METRQGYFDDLNALLAAMPRGELDMRQIEANERRHGHRGRPHQPGRFKRRRV